MAEFLFFFFFQRKIVTCMHNRTDVIRWRITFFDVVLEESWNAGREYRYSTVVSHEISSMAEPFDDKRTLARRGWKSKCVHPVVRHRGTNSTNWWVWGPMSINRQTRSSKPMAIPIPLTLFVRRLFYRSIEFPFLFLSLARSLFFFFLSFFIFSPATHDRHENTAFTVGMKYVFSKYRSLCRFHFYWWLFPDNKTLLWLKASSKIGKICSPIFPSVIYRAISGNTFSHRCFRNFIPRARFQLDKNFIYTYQKSLRNDYF